jgi:quercetin dioxygenase-like cupin family protein
MLTTRTSELELMRGWFDSDPDRTRVRVTFPINKWAGSGHSAVVYFEIEPGNRLAEHTDSAEEILYVVAGDAEARVGDERRRLSAGDLAVIPAMVPHGVVNVGSETVKVVGFFSESEIISTFNEPVQPFGAAVLNQGAPPPAASGSTTGSPSESSERAAERRRLPDRHMPAGGG